MLYHFLDILLFITHIVVILFNLFGWIWRRTRRAHLVVIGLTTMSWFILGIWYGMGYCFLTDWHWSIKRKLGVTQLPNSFIQYLFESLGFSPVADTTDMITALAYGACVIATILVNRKFIYRQYKKVKSELCIRTLS